MAFGNGPRIITNTLLLVVDAADRNSYVSGSTTWIDLGTANGDGTLTNGPTFNSDNEGSIVFDGVDDYVISGDIGGQYITVSVWVYKTSSTTNQGIVNRSNTAWAIAQIDNTIQVFLSTVGTFTNTGYTIPLNEWINIAYTYSGTGTNAQVLYINGISVFTGNGTGTLPLRIRTGTFTIGRYLGNSSYWGGKIAQVKTYARALEASEVLQNYNAQKSRFGL